jgi:hypothetical protein
MTDRHSLSGVLGATASLVVGAATYYALSELASLKILVNVSKSRKKFCSWGHIVGSLVSVVGGGCAKELHRSHPAENVVHLFLKLRRFIVLILHFYQSCEQ